MSQRGCEQQQRRSQNATANPYADGDAVLVAGELAAHSPTGTLYLGTGGTTNQLVSVTSVAGDTGGGGVLTLSRDGSTGALTGSVDVSGLVPYTGATGAVNLGTQNLSSGLVTVTGITGDGTVGVSLFGDAATGTRPRLRVYGYRDYTGVASAAQNYLDIGVDYYGYGKITGGGTGYLGLSVNGLALTANNDFLSLPQSNRYLLGPSSAQKGGGTTGSALYLGLGKYTSGGNNDSPHLVIGRGGAKPTFDFGHAYSADPAIFLHSYNNSTTEWLGMWHDQTDAHIETGKGHLLLNPVAGKSVVAGAPIRKKGYTVATLPAGTAGDCAFVTDALAPAWGVAVAGGGAVTVPVFYDGANWICG